ncbi:MAG: AmmeMemoRadiSam system radical SAM enzyme [Firmicutes bacterium]|jgi:pyruvate formate lyase activating enzyme|nr:AmmeMemoRadiSam system radical SAM enzyme [Bacillota bacterium]MDH7496568.1 AmmeMemoRadiSam system radical SAM enzyme [Bacillota bacterium]
MREASYWQAEGETGAVKCLLCPQYCRIRPGRVGVCRARKNIEGRLYSLVYGEITSFGLDPIEKKPLYHFYPGWEILSVGTRGCNLACGFCQNWHISQVDAPTQAITPQGLASAATEQTRRRPCVGVAYTYSEPLIWYEFVIDAAKLVRERGLKNVLVTNGEINEDPLEELLPHIDAMNIDVKAFTESFYAKICHGKLAPVLRTAELAKAAGCHVEITNLIIPRHNDDPGEIERLARWVASSLGDDTPLHFSRYFPAYEFKEPPTPVATLQSAVETARRVLKYVYMGNVPGGQGNDTRCYECGDTLIKRDGFNVLVYRLEDGKCPTCGAKIHVVGAPPSDARRGEDTWLPPQEETR